MNKHYPVIIEQDKDGIFIVECPNGLLLKIIRYDLEMDVQIFSENEPCRASLE